LDRHQDMRGFVDLQVNGFLGVDFSSPELDVEQVRRVVIALLDRGTAAFCPTVVTSRLESYEHTLPVLARAMEEPDLAPHLLGIHLEGPFLSPEHGARGAHPKKHLHPPSVNLYEKLRALASDRICLLTLAPELPGALELIRHARRTGAQVSLGHHIADRDTIARACEYGATAVTHLGNGIPNQIARHPNPLWDQLDEDRLSAMLIVDGHHLPDAFVRVVARVKGPDRLIVVSDAAPVAGLAPGRYEVLEQEAVLEESGRFWNPRENHLIGSSASALECVNRLAAVSSFTEAELWRVGRDNPLSLVRKSLGEPAILALPELRFRNRSFVIGGGA